MKFIKPLNENEIETLIAVAEQGGDEQLLFTRLQEMLLAPRIPGEAVGRALSGVGRPA